MNPKYVYSHGSTLWDYVVSFFHEFKVGETLHRVDYIQLADCTPLKVSRLDEYRCILKGAGYIQMMGKGVYKIKKRIPLGLTYSRARFEAYGERKRFTYSNLFKEWEPPVGTF